MLVSSYPDDPVKYFSERSREKLTLFPIKKCLMHIIGAERCEGNVVINSNKFLEWRG